MWTWLWQPLGGVLLALEILSRLSWSQMGSRPDTMRPVPALVMLPTASFLHLWSLDGNQDMVFDAPKLLLLVAEGSEVSSFDLFGGDPG